MDSAEALRELARYEVDVVPSWFMASASVEDVDAIVGFWREYDGAVCFRCGRHRLVVFMYLQVSLVLAAACGLCRSGGRDVFEVVRHVPFRGE